MTHTHRQVIKRACRGCRDLWELCLSGALYVRIGYWL